MDEAWAVTTGDSSVIIALLDTGLKMKHPEFQGRIWKNPDEIPNNGKDDDNNGYVDDIHGWDWMNDDNNTTDNGTHGTSITNILCANGDNGVGAAGVNWSSKIMVCKISDTSGAHSDHVAAAIYYAVAEKAKVINISIAFKMKPVLLKNAVTYAWFHDVIVCAGTGNDGADSVLFPASESYTPSVGSSNPDDTRSKTFFWGGGSNYGENMDILAPGQFILDLIVNENPEIYTSFSSGTSLSTAFVSGVASLLVSLRPDLTAQQIKTIITRSAEDEVGGPSEDTPGWDKYYGWGRLNAARAIALLDSPDVAITVLQQGNYEAEHTAGRLYMVQKGYRAHRPAHSIWHNLLGREIKYTRKSAIMVVSHPGRWQ
jgi:subtilisin family serine protease